MLDPQLEDPAPKRFRIAKQPGLDPDQPFRDGLPGPKVLEPEKPFLEGRRLAQFKYT